MLAWRTNVGHCIPFTSLYSAFDFKLEYLYLNVMLTQIRKKKKERGKREGEIKEKEDQCIHTLKRDIISTKLCLY